MSDAKLRDSIEIIDLTEKMPPSQPYRDPILVYGVGLLIVAILSFYGRFKWAVDRKTATKTQATLAIGRACIDYVHGLRPGKSLAKREAAVWIANNCEHIAERSMERINGIKMGMVR